ncbi:hypothetical protein BJF90_13545 [Pseudonocardia sp. CNS-004]|nr:hypothetical protein BJF90_13545 [Pseudonocardia sp. CNS-004]
MARDTTLGDISQDLPQDTALAPAVASAAAGRRVPRWVGPAATVAVLACLLFMPQALGLGGLTTATTVLMYAVVALGWNLLGGAGGYLNFGMAVFFGAGVYTAAALNALGWGLWAGLVPAVVVATLIAVPVGLVTLRLRGYFFAIFTLVLTFLAQIVVRNSPWLGGAEGLYTTVDTTGGPRALAATFYYALLGLVVLAAAVAFLVEHSTLGHALRAIREDEDAAVVLGVRTVGVKMRALLIGAALAGAAGAVYAFLTGYVEPNGAFDVSFSLDIVLVCVIGGLGTWRGPLIGAAVVVLLEQWLRTAIVDLGAWGLDIPAEANRVVLGVLLIVFALFARRGIAGLFQRRRGRVVGV